MNNREPKKSVNKNYQEQEGYKNNNSFSNFFWYTIVSWLYKLFSQISRCSRYKFTKQNFILIAYWQQ